MNARTSMLVLGLIAGCILIHAGCETETVVPAVFGGRPESDEQFAILLATFSGPDHGQQAMNYLSSVRDMTGWQRLHVHSDEDGSRLLWGEYSSIKAAAGDLERAKAFRSSSGQQAFAMSMIVPVAGKSVGPPEWDLSRSGGAYTVMVAVFYNVADAGYVGRKKFAVDYCRQLRDAGEQAYYHHGPVRSIVTVGLFGPDAIQHVRRGDATRTVARDSRIARIMQRKQFEFLAVNGRQEKVKILNPVTGRYESTVQRPRVIAVPSGKEDDGLCSNGRSGDS